MRVVDRSIWITDKLTTEIGEGHRVELKKRNLEIAVTRVFLIIGGFFPCGRV